MPETCYAAGFEDGGRELWAKECGQSLEAKEVKETDSLLEAPARSSPVNTDFSPVRPVSDFWTTEL